MCTLIVLHRCVPGSPLVIAANRDEYLDRPASPPALRDDLGAGRVAAPADERAGGTWLGVNAAGLFAAITNRPTKRPDPARRSRGLLVLDALAEGDARTAAATLATLPSDAYNPFNLVVADRDHAFACVYEGRPRVAPLAPGVHVVCNAEPDDTDVPKVARLAERARKAAAGDPERVLDTLAELCRGHEGGAALDDACIHLPGYGTRSSTLLRLADDAGDAAWRFADGPPCRNEYEDFTHLLDALDHRVDARPGARIARTAP